MPSRPSTAAQRHQQAQLEAGLHAQARSDAAQQRLEHGARLGRVLLLVQAGAQPVAGQGGVELAAGALEDLDRLAGGSDRLGAAVEPGQRLGLAAQQLGALLRVGRRLEQRRVAVDRTLPVAGSELQVDVEPVPGRLLVGHQPAGRRAQPSGQVVERDHRWLDQGVLERADVGLGVSIAGQLLLGQAGLESGGLEAAADAHGQRALGGGGGRAWRGLGQAWHEAEFTPQLTRP